MSQQQKEKEEKSQVRKRITVFLCVCVCLSLCLSLSQTGYGVKSSVLFITGGTKETLQTKYIIKVSYFSPHDIISFLCYPFTCVYPILERRVPSPSPKLWKHWPIFITLVLLLIYFVYSSVSNYWRFYWTICYIPDRLFPHLCLPFSSFHESHLPFFK